MSKHDLTAEERFCLQGCRNYKQYYKMRKTFEEGICGFCDLDRSLNSVLWEDKSATAWQVPQQFKRRTLEHHMIVIPKRHIRFEADLTLDENTSIWDAKRFLRDKFEYQGSMTCVREGDMSLNAGTVPHLHYNIMVPNGTGEVRVPVFKDPADRDANLARAARFAERYENGEVPE